MHARGVHAPLFDDPTMTYEILVRGTVTDTLIADLDARCSEQTEGKTVIVVAVVDQSHLHGILARLGDLNIEIESVNPSREA